jgi:ABC-2 type transport system ATP-binding protein
MSIEVQNISKSYGAQKALDSVSFSVKKGEIVGFLGPNGAGKSTLMKILTTYINADEGTASVNGNDVAQNQKRFNFRLAIYRSTIRCIWICM